MTRETIQKEATKASQLAGIRVLSIEEEAYLQALQVIMAIESKKYNSFTEWTKYLGKLYAISCKYGYAH